MKILDCTLRDGGYINNWEFSQDFARSLVKTCVNAQLDYVEVGFTKGDNSGPDFSAKNVKSCEPLISNSELEETKLSVMTNFDESMLEKKFIVPAGADLIRIATHYHTFEDALEFTRMLDKEIEIAINFMGVSNYSNDQLKKILSHLDWHGHISYCYFADSFGACTPTRLREIIHIAKGHIHPNRIGFHPHDNISCAFANTLIAQEMDIGIVDSSILGMGRGAGNLRSELIVGHLEQGNENYVLDPILEFIDNEMSALVNTYDWGFSIPQLLSGLLSVHPNHASAIRSEPLQEIYKKLRSLNPHEKKLFKGKL